jgi:hypothetical protein
MPNKTTQAKFTVDASIFHAFKARCANANVSMASAILRFMETYRPAKEAKLKADTRGRRRTTVMEIIGILNAIMESESEYLENIPETFEQRIEAAEHACTQLAEAIACLEDAF